MLKYVFVIYKFVCTRVAGIDIWRVINEPTAAALAYGLDKRDNIRHVIVVDLGGGTLDVSLMFVQGGMFSTQAMAGKYHFLPICLFLCLI